MDAYTATQQQDEQRTARAFISFLGTAFGVNDQSTAGQDADPYNLPRQYQSIGPYGHSVEGYPVSTTQTGALLLSPSLLWLGAAAAAAYLLTR